jgi:diketogulonate reductase-like aldo/keto reductase
VSQLVYLIGISFQVSSWQAIRECGIPREELFVTTKLASAYHGCVKDAFEQSFSNLDIGYIDLYLVSSLSRSKTPSNPGDALWCDADSLASSFY